MKPNKILTIRLTVAILSSIIFFTVICYTPQKTVKEQTDYSREKTVTTFSNAKKNIIKVNIKKSITEVLPTEENEYKKEINSDKENNSTLFSKKETTESKPGISKNDVKPLFYSSELLTKQPDSINDIIEIPASYNTLEPKTNLLSEEPMSDTVLYSSETSLIPATYNDKHSTASYAYKAETSLKQDTTGTQHFTQSFTSETEFTKQSHTHTNIQNIDFYAQHPETNINPTPSKNLQHAPLYSSETFLVPATYNDKHNTASYAYKAETSLKQDTPGAQHFTQSFTSETEFTKQPHKHTNIQNIDFYAQQPETNINPTSSKNLQHASLYSSETSNKQTEQNISYYSLNKEEYINLDTTVQNGLIYPEINLDKIYNRITYPTSMKKNNIEASFIVTVYINKTGDIHLEFPENTQKPFRNAIISAFKGQKIKPAMLNGTKINSAFILPVRFILE